MTVELELTKLQNQLMLAEKNYKSVLANNNYAINLARDQVIMVQSKIMSLDPRVK